MNFRSVADLSATIARHIHDIPSNIELVVGVPRSGLVPASLIALARNLPLVDLDGYINGRAFAAGITRHTRGLSGDARQLSHVLVVDDSILSGRTIAQVKARLQEHGLSEKAKLLAVYGTRSSRGCVDIQLETVAAPRVFEWNLFHHPLLAEACVDIDGVLCRDPTDSENDDGDRYRDFLENAPCRYRPAHHIGTLVSNRLEKYRAPTESWLKRNGITYDELVMLDLPAPAERQKIVHYGKFKGEVFRSRLRSLFIESSDQQAHEVAFFSGKPCISVETMRMIRPDGLTLAQLAVARHRLSTRIKRRLFRMLRAKA